MALIFGLIGAMRDRNAAITSRADTSRARIRPASSRPLSKQRSSDGRLTLLRHPFAYRIICATRWSTTSSGTAVSTAGTNGNSVADNRNRKLRMSTGTRRIWYTLATIE